MVNSGLYLVLLVAYEAASQSDDARWVWGARGGRRTYTGVASALVPPSQALFSPSDNDATLSPQATKLRYQVSEPSDFPSPPSRPGNRPPIYPEEQYRPTTSTVNGFRPDPLRPSNRPSQNEFRPDEDGFRPSQNGFRPNQNGFRPNGNGVRPNGDGYSPPNRPVSGGYRPTTGPGGRPVLTGPVPSWEQGDSHRYKEYERCKCVHSFNCNTPGIKFGSCDVDKQYCCYNDAGGHGPGGHHSPGARPESGGRPRPVLAGPGGPVDRPSQYRPYNQGEISNRPYRPDFSNTRYSDRFDDNSSEESLEEAYKKGLESAIRETFERPSGGRGYSSEDSFNRRPRPNHKYGLYEPSAHYDFYGGRSANLNSTIGAEPQVRKN